MARGSDFVRNASNIIWEPNALYFQPEVGYDLLREILELNKEKLGKIKVNSELYGKFSLSGAHPVYDKHYESIPNQHIFLREEQVWTDIWKTYYQDDILDELFKGIRDYEMPARYTRFEYEIKKYSAESVPEVFKKAIEGECNFDKLEFEEIYDTWQPKRKPKKRKLPKSDANVLSLSHKPQKIEGQDLTIKDFESIEQGNFLVPLTSKLSKPKTLKELAEFGVKNPMYAVNVLFELMDQLYRNDDYNVLVLVDQFNEFYLPSEYPSLKYMNYKKLDGFIPPYDLSLSRLFMRFDGHMIKNGAKIVAVSEKNTCYTTTDWKGDPLNIGQHFSTEVSSLALDDLRKLIKYYTFYEWTNHTFTETDIATIYMQCQGNFGLALENITFSTEKTY